MAKRRGHKNVASRRVCVLLICLVILGNPDLLQVELLLNLLLHKSCNVTRQLRVLALMLRMVVRLIQVLASDKAVFLIIREYNFVGSLWDFLRLKFGFKFSQDVLDVAPDQFRKFSFSNVHHV
jgi:hypothetical protein